MTMNPRVFGKTLFGNLPPITTTVDHKDMLTTDNLSDSPDLRVFQRDMSIQAPAYLITPVAVQNTFMAQDDILYKLTQEGDKMFKALIVPKSLASSILVNAHNLQGCASAVKMSCLIKKDFF